MRLPNEGAERSAATPGPTKESLAGQWGQEATPLARCWDSQPTPPARLGLCPGAAGVFQGGTGTMLKGRAVSDKTIWV